MARRNFSSFTHTDPYGDIWRVALDTAVLAPVPGDDTDVVATAPDGQVIQFLDGVQSNAAIMTAIDAASAAKHAGRKGPPWLLILLIAYALTRKGRR